MQRMDGSELRIAIVDYQSCVFAASNLDDKHFLSPNLINFIAEKKYNFFIGHTFRCFINIDSHRERLLAKVPVSEQDKFTKNFPTVKITKHIVKHAKTPCLTVSTLDDMVTGQVGLGYQDLENYEMHGVIPENQHVQEDELIDLMRQNNNQLLLIAKFIAAEFPDKVIQLDIIDDDLKHGRDALSAAKQAGWPHSVKINTVYRYSTNILDDQVTRVTDSDVTLANQRAKHAAPSEPKSSRADDSVHAASASALVSGSASLFASSAVAAAAVQPRRSERLAAKQLRR